MASEQYPKSNYQNWVALFVFTDSARNVTIYLLIESVLNDYFWEMKLPKELFWDLNHRIPDYDKAADLMHDFKSD